MKRGPRLRQSRNRQVRDVTRWWPVPGTVVPGAVTIFVEVTGMEAAQAGSAHDAAWNKFAALKVPGFDSLPPK